MADWERALDKQLATYVWWHTDSARHVAEAWTADVNAKYGVRGQDSPDRLIRQQLFLLWHADPIYVTPGMADLLEAAWPSFEPEPLREEDLIVPHGFALLPRTFPIVDVWGKTVTIRAIGWTRSDIGDKVVAGDPQNVKPGLLVSLYSEPDDRDDYVTQGVGVATMRRIFGDAMSLVVTSPLTFGEDLVERFSAVVAERADADQIDPAVAALSATQEIRLLQCFWRLTKQQIAVGFRQRPSRGTRRRSEAASYPEKYVTVVTLRRPKPDPSGEHHAVDWQVRWIVSGHWRWQPYKDGTVRQIWIAPYVKGPEDRPLAIRKLRVFQWTR